ncbi:hypothetical protein KAFR_0B02160 [Kazachstania africana CBS 2517]|uniref:C2H2-type domain-containing protein n=1 Tax=Kazachstania africana (strain ATCC 22294 / BCRC 22015 / CBS 2517 / CECT 1963 / NBRC 1671 / NRRL Y-8276) TaxID=1071382 RepID=H2AQ64_KAZAF|nr:hypothetical protein KAFR_0B02160 [Kazachstania africana CBS 2517]CCF56514.1 hypothetical protein KAFR_0B02160 [Kazachstania africana CBS 2517]
MSYSAPFLQRFDSDTTINYLLDYSKQELLPSSYNNQNNNYQTMTSTNTLQFVKQADTAVTNNINNDLTGNTLTNELSDNMLLEIENDLLLNTKKERRLSISNYVQDKSKYFEIEEIDLDLEFQNVKRNDLAISMGVNNDDFQFNINNNDLLMIDQNNNNDINDNDFQTYDEDDLDIPLINNDNDQQLPTMRRRKRDIFKFNNFFGGNNSNNDSQISTDNNYKKKHFWSSGKSSQLFKKFNNSRSNINGLSNNNDDDDDIDMDFDVSVFNFSEFASENEDLDDLIIEETNLHTLINPSKLIQNNETITPSTINPVSPFSNLNSTPFVTTSSFSSKNPFNMSNNSESTSSSMSPVVATTTDEATSQDNKPALKNKKSGISDTPKIRGRKPSLLDDGTKQFSCEYCDRRFKRQEHLKRHIRSLHICEKPFHCHICDKHFSRSDNLNQHIKTHSNTN